MTLRVNAICKSFGSRRALDRVDLAVEAGEFAVLLGPNGAGKTTLFQILSGLFVADSGSARVGDADIGSAPIAALRQIGIVFQQPALDLDLSVAANLRFQTDLHGIGRGDARQRIADALTRFGLAERAHESARVLSGGNRRKVELARALLTRPKLLLMDEATVGIDPAARAQILHDVRAMCKEQGIAVLWATHLVDEADGADRIVVLDKGRVRFDGSGEQLLAKQGGCELTAAFLSLTKPE